MTSPPDPEVDEGSRILDGLLEDLLVVRAAGRRASVERVSRNHLLRGWYLYATRRFELAISEVLVELESAPRSAEANRLLALCYLALDRPVDALGPAREGLATAPDCCDAHDTLARVEAQRGRLRAACRSARRAVQLDPADPEHFALLSRIHGCRQQWRSALDVAEDGLILDPEHTGCLEARSTALDALGRVVDWRHSVRSWLEVAPEDADGLAHLGWARIDEGDLDDARDALEAALCLQPDHLGAQEGLRQVDQAESWPFGRQLLRLGALGERGRARLVAILLFTGMLIPVAAVVLARALAHATLALARRAASRPS